MSMIEAATYVPRRKIPVGRPTKYKPEYCERVYNMMRDGYSVTRCAVELGVDEASLRDWAKVHSDFSRVITLGRQAQKAWYEVEGINHLGDRNYNTAMFKFITANMLGWSEKQQITQETTVNVTVQHQLGAEIFESLPEYAQPLGITRNSRTTKRTKEIEVKAEET